MHGIRIGRRKAPIEAPGLRGPRPLRFVREAREHVRVQRRFDIAENRVIDTQRRRGGQDGIAQRGHVGQKLHAAHGGQGIQLTTPMVLTGAWCLRVLEGFTREVFAMVPALIAS